ncbi:MAG: BrnA antitoxin family protein [Gammaproteobacteria bacterium]
MSKAKMTRALLTEDGAVLVEQPDGSYRRAEGKTDWKRLAAMPDEEIDYSEIPELEETFWANAALCLPQTKDRVTLRLDHDVLQWFKEQGRGYQSRINAILRRYMESHRRQLE